ncbi:MAG: hypothetical protein KKD39_00205, partial [Candidatus Altiarchaeota archaeon]|nr:hypothetical protein [Candidatus Altiarchaeota archaeon]
MAFKVSNSSERLDGLVHDLGSRLPAPLDGVSGGGLFSGKTSLKAMFPPEVRDRVERLILVHEKRGVSRDILYLSELLQETAFTSFRNAEVLVYSNVGEIVAPPPGRALIHPGKTFTQDVADRSDWFAAKKDNSVVFLFFPQDLDKSTLTRACSLAVQFPFFGLKNMNYAEAYNPVDGSSLSDTFEVVGDSYQKRQRSILGQLGLETPEGDELVLGTDRFSPALKERIKVLKSKLPADKPV